MLQCVRLWTEHMHLAVLMTNLDRLKLTLAGVVSINHEEG